MNNIESYSVKLSTDRNDVSRLRFGTFKNSDKAEKKRLETLTKNKSEEKHVIN